MHERPIFWRNKIEKKIDMSSAEIFYLNKNENNKCNESRAQHFLQNCMCAQRLSEDSVQPAEYQHLRSLIRAFARHCLGNQGSQCLQVDSEDADQLAQMRWLIYGLARHTHMQSCRKCYAPAKMSHND